MVNNNVKNKSLSKKNSASKNIETHTGKKYFSEKSSPKKGYLFSSVLNDPFTKNILLVTILILLIVFGFMHLKDIVRFIGKVLTILAPVIIGWVFTFMMDPLYNRIVKWLSKNDNKAFVKFSRIIATIICVIIFVGFTVGMIFLFVPQLYNSIVNFSGRASGYLANVKDVVGDVRDTAKNDAAQQMLKQVEKTISDTMDSSPSFNFSAIVSGLYTGFAVSFKAVLNYFLAIVVMIYSLNMKDEFADGLKRILFALTRKDVGLKILEEVGFAKKVFSGFFVGKLLDSLIIGIICYVCCLLMRIPYTPLISVIVGITNIIPFFGPFIGAIPSFILILLEEPTTIKPYVFLVFVLILQQIDGNIIGPKILGNRTGVGSFWVLFSIVLFGGLFGFVGMIIAVPLWAVITRIFDEIVTLQLARKDYPLTTAEYKKLKEYNLQKLEK